MIWLNTQDKSSLAIGVMPETALRGLLADPLFHDRLEHAIAQSERSGRPFALIALQLQFSTAHIGAGRERSAVTH